MRETSPLARGIKARRHAGTKVNRIVFATSVVMTLAGCSWTRKSLAPAPTFPRGMSIAVAPILNFSGSFDLDPVKAADLLASELTDFDGIVVLPVSRVVAALMAEGRDQIESPRHALEIARRVGADAIIVAGITEYDPYTPTVGLAIQLYAETAATRMDDGPFASSPAEGGRYEGPIIDDDAVRANEPMRLSKSEDSLAPLGQIQKVYNATHDDVVSDVRRYARNRDAGDSPYGWQEYLKVQTQYLRFCWHDALERMASKQAGLFAAASDLEEEHAE
jgi:hypothetical protein